MKRTQLKHGNKGLKRTGFKNKYTRLNTKSRIQRTSSAGTFKSLLSTLQRRYNLLRRMEESNAAGICQCYTCSASHHYSDMDCGHYYHTQAHPAVRMSKMNTHPQCRNCNSHGDGKLDVYKKLLVDGYGMQAFLDLTREAKTSKKVMKIDILRDLKDVNIRITHERERLGIHSN